MGETASTSRAGSQVGRYILKRLLGRGATGEVYEALDSVTEQTVAVKLLSAALSQDPAFRDQMQQDAYVVSRLRGPHIVPINDFGDIDGNLFVEMPLVEGSDLSALMDQVGALPPSRAVNIVRQAASALDSAHALGIIHGNIKPHNILVADGDTVHLVDFAISSGTSDTDEQWKYAAPELFLEADLDPSIDIYALTGVLYQCLTGSPPYAGDWIEPLATAHLTQPIPRPSQGNPHIPMEFDAVIAKGMAKGPRERYASAGALDLAAYQALNSPTSQVPAVPQPQHIPSPAPAQQISPPPPPGPTVPTPPPVRPEAPPQPPPPAVTDWDPRVGHPTPVRSGRPMAASTPVAAHSAWPTFASEPSRHENPLADRKQLLRIGAALAVVIGLILWLVNRSPGGESTAESQPTESAAADTSLLTIQADQARARLFKLLPVGYPPNVCKPMDPLGGAVAELSCGKNIDTDGPQSATYTLFPDLGALHLSFDTTVQTSSVVNCPGRIQSPGAWHRTTSPDKAGGMLLCAMRQGIPTLVWTNDSDLLVGAIQATRPGASLDQLYAWWSSHS